MRKRIALVAMTAMAVTASPALAADRTVAKPTDLACGKGTPYNTIQSAVTASNAGDTIHVCPGLYQEQVVIGPGKNNLKLESVKDRQAAIKFPSGVLTDPKAVVLVRQSTGVVIHDFTIEGPWGDTSDCTSTRHYSIRVDSGGSARIDSNHITVTFLFQSGGNESRERIALKRVERKSSEKGRSVPMISHNV